MCAERDLASVIQRFVPPEAGVRSDSPPTWRMGIPPAAVVVATSGRKVSFITEALRRAEEEGLRARTVVVAPFSRELATALVRQGCAHVVWLDAVSRELPSVLRRLVESSLRFAVADAIRSRCGDDPLLLRVVGIAFGGPECPTTVSDLALRVHCTTSTLRAHWRRSGLPDSPQALVEWAVLSVLAERRSDGSKVSSVSRELGLHETTLYRASRRRLGVSPSAVNHDSIFSALGAWLQAQAS